ncbi:MAG: GHKL domain-containing protein [Cyanobacteria bacterium SBLK]|nr:GHKL domain-containing protein [Cyanobacteria bacterium SBLK]
MLPNTLSPLKKVNLFDRIRFSDRISEKGKLRTVQRWGSTICYSRTSPHSVDLSIGVQCEDGTIYQISDADIIDRLPAKQTIQPKFNLGNLVRVEGLNNLCFVEGVGLSFQGDRDILGVSYDLSLLDSQQNQILPDVREHQLQDPQELLKTPRIASTCQQFLVDEAILFSQEIENRNTVSEIIEILGQRCSDRFEVRFAYLTPTIYPEHFPIAESSFLREKIQATQTIYVRDTEKLANCFGGDRWNFSTEGGIAFIRTLQSADIRSLLCVPFRSNLGHIGALALFDSHPRPWENESLFLRSILTTLAAAIDRGNLLATEKAVEKTIAAQAETLVKERIEAQKKIAQQEKMAALGQLIAGIAHEINNPLNFIKANLSPISYYSQDVLELAQRCRDRCSSPDIQDYIEEIDLDFLIEDFPKIIDSMKQGCDRVSNLVNSLRLFSRGQIEYPSSFEIEQGLENTLTILQGKLNHGILVKRNYGNLPAIDCYAGQLKRALMNILSNAIDALENCKNPQIEITTQIEGENVMISIRDNGVGIPDDARSRIFDPFFTTKPVGKGTGLGLSISHQIIVEKHGGILECFSELGCGTEFRITIPANHLED